MRMSEKLVAPGDPSQMCMSANLGCTGTFQQEQNWVAIQDHETDCN